MLNVPSELTSIKIGSGLSDRGLLDFANNNLLGQDFSVDQITDRIAERLNDNTALKGVTIVWDGLGQTAPPQQYLSKESTDKLKQIYSAIFTELGASRSNIRFKNKLNGDASVDTNVYVKTSSTGEEPLNWTKQYTGDVTSAFQFVGDSAAFIDQQATDAGISEIVDVASIYLTVFFCLNLTTENIHVDLDEHLHINDDSWNYKYSHQVWFSYS